MTAAEQIGGDIHLQVIGKDCQVAAEDAASINGVAKVLKAESSAFEHNLPEVIAEQILSIADGYSHLLIAANSSGKAVMPRVAAKLDVEQISEIVRVVSADTFERPIYAGNAIATVQSEDAIKVITVRTTAFAPAEKGGAASIENAGIVDAYTKASFQS